MLNHATLSGVSAVAPIEDPDQDAWLTINQACTQVNRSRRTIYHWITKGLLVTRREAGGAQQILASSLYREASSVPRDAATAAAAALAPEPTVNDELDTE